jgi:hypothetical protein
MRELCSRVTKEIDLGRSHKVLHTASSGRDTALQGQGQAYIISDGRFSLRCKVRSERESAFSF